MRLPIGVRQRCHRTRDARAVALRVGGSVSRSLSDGLKAELRTGTPHACRLPISRASHRQTMSNIQQGISNVQVGEERECLAFRPRIRTSLALLPWILSVGCWIFNSQNRFMGKGQRKPASGPVSTALACSMLSTVTAEGARPSFALQAPPDGSG